MQTLIIHGRQPALGRAELESLYGADGMRPVGEIASLMDIDPTNIDFSRLGGMVKFCKVLTILDTTAWDEIEKFLIETTPEHFSMLPEGKLKIGLSVYNLDASPKRIQATALKIKKAGKETGRSVRVVPNKEKTLNSATVLYNKLTQKLGWELVFIRDGQKTILAQSIAVQDIDKYAARDQARPYRDARVGMLPPKLAQIILNLSKANCHQRILDPFCGTGVLLQEGLLMGCLVYGTDIDPKMIDFSEKNLDWICEKHGISKDRYELTVGDATETKWENFEVIACETYLGRPFSALPDENTLRKVVQDCDTIHIKFLQNVAMQTKPGIRMCIAVPAWKTKRGFKHLPTLDKLENLGYNRLSFAHARVEDLIYHRPNQIVGRELVVLERN